MKRLAKLQKRRARRDERVPTGSDIKQIKPNLKILEFRRWKQKSFCFFRFLSMKRYFVWKTLCNFLPILSFFLLFQTGICTQFHFVIWNCATWVNTTSGSVHTDQCVNVLRGVDVSLIKAGGDQRETVGGKRKVHHRNWWFSSSYNTFVCLWIQALDVLLFPGEQLLKCTQNRHIYRTEKRGLSSRGYYLWK